MGFPNGSAVKNPPAIQETQVQSLDQKAHLEEEMATHSSIVAWEIPWTEQSGGLQSIRLQRVGHNLAYVQAQRHKQMGSWDSHAGSTFMFITSSDVYNNAVLGAVIFYPAV